MEELLELVEKGRYKGYITVKGKIDENQVDLVFITYTKGIYRDGADKVSANTIRIQIPSGNIFYSMDMDSLVSSLTRFGKLDKTTAMCVNLMDLFKTDNIDDIYYGDDSISINQGSMELDDDKTDLMQLKRNLREVTFHLYG